MLYIVMYYYMLLCTLTCRTSKCFPPQTDHSLWAREASLPLSGTVHISRRSQHLSAAPWVPLTQIFPSQRTRTPPHLCTATFTKPPQSPGTPLTTITPTRSAEPSAPRGPLTPGPPCTTCTERTLTPVTALCSCPRCGRIDFLQPRFPHLEPRHAISARVSRAARRGPELSQRRALIWVWTWIQVWTACNHTAVFIHMSYT